MMTKEKSAAAKEALLQELVAELKHLRGLVREVGENFILRREGEIETVISYLDGIPGSRLKHEAPQWLREIRAMKMKPGKGRLKDVKGIDELIDDLTDRVINAQGGSRPKGKG